MITSVLLLTLTFTFTLFHNVASFSPLLPPGRGTTAGFGLAKQRTRLDYVSLPPAWPADVKSIFPSPPPSRDELREVFFQAPQALPPFRRFSIFCDLDGVLCDFAHGITRLFPQMRHKNIAIDDLPRGTMWKRVQDDGSFFENLPWTETGQQLWQTIMHLEPDILTGVPCYTRSRQEKFLWCRRELGVNVSHLDMAGSSRTHCQQDGRKQDRACNVITCWSDNKHYESAPGHVLIDDREALRQAWEAAGGIFIHHNTGDLDRTLQQLRKHGILDESL
jgi:hypothetical protein